MTKRKKFSILVGEDIREAYDTQSAHKAWLDLYCNEPNIRVLVLSNENTVIGKALLWNVRWRKDWSYPLQDGIFMDSVWVENKIHEELFNRYAVRHDFIYRIDGIFYKIKGKDVYYPKMKVWLKNKYPAYPRLGTTMQYVSRAKSSLSNYKTTTTK